MRITAKHYQNKRESPALRGWLLSFFDDYPRRMLVALAVAIAVHEIIAAVFPWQPRTIPTTPSETITIAKLVRIEHRPKPTPTPSPKPTPIVHTRVVAQTNVQPHIVSPAAPSQNEHHRRIASARPLVHTHYHAKPARIHVVMGGHGAGTSTVAKAATGGIGPGGNGTGISGNGNGTGAAPLAHEPCGYVDFLLTDLPTIDQSTGRVWEHVMIRVRFPDGTQQSVPLDYPFYYPSKAADPFQQTTKTATFQFPPTQLASGEPDLVQYVVAHTTPDGYTLLRECPGAQ